jgi:hypothetical protein
VLDRVREGEIRVACRAPTACRGRKTRSIGEDHVSLARRRRRRSRPLLRLRAHCIGARLGPSGTPGAPGIGDPYFPLDGNGGYDTLHYLLDLRYDPATDLLQGEATIRARATQNLSSFNLDLIGLNLRAIEVNGRSAHWTRDAHELTITPRKTLRKHREFVVSIVYDGVPHTVNEPSLGENGFFNTDDGSLVAGEPHGAAGWYRSMITRSTRPPTRFASTCPPGSRWRPTAFCAIGTPSAAGRRGCGTRPTRWRHS